MKRTRRKHFWRDLRGSLNRFLSILFIVALGSGFMAGLAATSPDMYDTADRYMDDSAYYDMDLKSPLGFTEADVAAVAGLDVVDLLYAARVKDAELWDVHGEAYTSRIYAVLRKDGSAEMNRPVLVEGRLPQSPDECLIQATSGRYFNGNVGIGDTLQLSESDAAGTVSAASRTLMVVGFAESPMCISVTAEASTVGSGKVVLHVYTQEAFFSSDVYTDLYLTVKDAAGEDCFSETYSDRIDAAKEVLKVIGKERTAARLAELCAEADDAAESLRSLAATAASLSELQVTMAQGTAALLPQNAAAAGMTAGSAPVLASLLQKTQAGIVEALTGSAAGGDAVLARLEAARAEAEATADALRQSSADWILRTREDSVGYSSYKNNVGKVAALSKVFPVFFFLVALLVALTTMTRLVAENRGQIGTLKALGFSNGQILSEYLIYSLSASVLGCVLGFAVGFRLFPMAISSAYGMMFTVPETMTPFRPEIALWVAPITVGSILAATLIACWGEFRACPAVLLRPEAPAAGKRILLERIPFLWKRLPFSAKVTCRNLFRYKKRFFMTVIGVAGCSALLLTGFGLRDSINDIVDLQFGEIYKYDMSLILTDPEAWRQEGNSLTKKLEDRTKTDAWMAVSDGTGRALANDKNESVTLFVPENSEKMEQFITLRERKSGKAIPFPDADVVLTEKLSETLGVSVGDTVTLENGAGLRRELTVAGITENYLSSYAYLSADAYSGAFGTDPVYRTILCKSADGTNREDRIAELMADDAVLYVNSSDSLRESFADSIKSIDGVILVLILAAGLLCMVVLYNLTNVNICERRRELATIRVLGFHRREVERYIFRETNLLSLIGALAGLVVGIFLHAFVVRTVEIDMVMFGRTIYPLSYLFALLISVFFTLLVNQVMRRQIRKIDMVEAMKANE